ncbi:DsbA family oxidoreductase [Nocardioides sp. BP30]|uniref:DsbA family oxidoreductase n=1 Tax=Nocardioides sp. BP30 TaxID=3036374 RepID=UPI002468E615|nr:DsbA family oxidoreductase [Nocardioides sp. BP30]WGL53622.1 DsbA family oxidoreductase [Nocardioides sp. BP30]
MRIDIWSDIACPWCYVGKRRLESALAAFPHRDEVEVVWHSFELMPDAPEQPVETAQEMLARKFGVGREQAAEMQQRVSALAAEEGMTWDHEHSVHVRTRAAHRLLHLALEEGGPAQQGALKEALLDTYFVQAGNVADPALLLRLATSVGLDAQRVGEVLGSQEYDDAVAADVAQAARYGATGVPFYVIDEKYGVSGAQPAELFGQVLDKAWADSHPLVETFGGGADVCGPDGCAI